MFQRRSRIAKPKEPGHLRVRRACACVGCAKYKIMAYFFFSLFFWVLSSFFSLPQLSVFDQFSQSIIVKKDSREILSTRHDASVTCMSSR